MERDHNEFDLSNFIIDSLCLDNNISPHSKYQYKKVKEDPIEEMLRKDPREVLGFNSFGKPRQIPESTIGTTIQEFYRGLNILVTGGTGFVGKALTEKLIRSIPHLGQIYVLMRAKKGVSARERFEKLLEDEVFLRMKTEVPDYQSKLTLVEGDISEPELGLSEEDRQTLQSQVNIVFHSAADVRFVNSLRAAVNTNLVGSKRVIDLAKGMTNLKSYVHVSTAFSNCVRKVIEEKIYKLSVSLDEIMKLLEEKSDDEIKAEETRILQGWPNTYTFSKALCEDMISEEAKGLPLCIFRPSIVGPSYQEPLRAWTDNIYGPNGMLLAIGLGVLHIMNVEISLPIDTVPVDFTVNAMIAVAWENATDRIDSLPVYNFTSSPRQPLTWKMIEGTGRRWLDPYPFQQAIWYTSFINAPNNFLERVGDFFLHKIPGLVLDKIAVATGQEPRIFVQLLEGIRYLQWWESWDRDPKTDVLDVHDRLTKVYTKLSVMKEQIDYFLFGTWEFQNNNTALLMNKLSEEDKQLFFYDISVVILVEYFLLCRLGLKYFYLKESLEKMPEAVRKWAWLKVAHRSLLVVSSLAVLKLLVTLAHILPI